MKAAMIARLVLIGLAAATAATAQTSALVPAASPLPAGPGRETVLRVCSGCHAPEIVAPQRLSPADWGRMVETMAGNGAQASEAEFAEIKAYLAKSFPAPPGS